jgi:predicted membrane-bound mannosyltransferase
MNNKRKIAIAASALAAFASIVLISNQASASNSTTPTTTPTVTAPILPLVMPTAGASESDSNAPDGDNVQSGDQNTPDVAGANSETDGTDVQSGDTAGDNNQSGDQNTPDVASATDSESSN